MFLGSIWNVRHSDTNSDGAQYAIQSATYRLLPFSRLFAKCVRVSRKPCFAMTFEWDQVKRRKRWPTHLQSGITFETIIYGEPSLTSSKGRISSTPDYHTASDSMVITRHQTCGGRSVYAKFRVHLTGADPRTVDRRLLLARGLLLEGSQDSSSSRLRFATPLILLEDAFG